MIRQPRRHCQCPLPVTLAEGDAEVALAAQAIIGALGVLTAVEVEGFHEGGPQTESEAMDILCPAL
jgi:hypothetical protein